MNMLCIVAHIILRDFRSSESFQTVSVTSAVTAVIWNLPHIKLFIGKHVIEWGFVFFMVMINISMYILLYFIFFIRIYLENEIDLYMRTSPAGLLQCSRYWHTHHALL